jgi:ferritin-like metal-binding protein YciE
MLTGARPVSVEETLPASQSPNPAKGSPFLKSAAMANETAKTVLTVGLRNAHAMESQALELLERQAGRLEEFPEVQAVIQRHVEETKAQLERLEECLKVLGEDSSTIKDTALSALGNIMALSNTVADDEILKNTFANYSFEHYEIAAYESLLELTKLADERELEPYLKASLAEEEAMARWIGNSIARVTRDYVNQIERKDRAA